MVRLLLTDRRCFDSVKLIAFTGSSGVSPDSFSTWRNLYLFGIFTTQRKWEKEKRRAQQLMCTASSNITNSSNLHLGRCKTFYKWWFFCEWLESRAYGKTALMCAMKLDTDLSVFVCIEVLSGCGCVSGRESASLYLGLVTLRWIWVTRTWHDVYICVLYALSRASHTHMHAHAGRPSVSGSHWRRRAEQQMS